MDKQLFLHPLCCVIVMLGSCLKTSASPGLLLGTGAPVMTPDGIDFCFLFSASTACLLGAGSGMMQSKLQGMLMLNLAERLKMLAPNKASPMQQ